MTKEIRPPAEGFKPTDTRYQPSAAEGSEQGTRKRKAEPNKGGLFHIFEEVIPQFNYALLANVW